MVFLSAQPDDFYFLWQLQIQLFNFKRVGVDSRSIHVLIGYNPTIGLKNIFRQFIDSNNDACYFLYEDERENKNYKSSIRPHIIRKHFKAYPYLEQEVIFYHDSDIIFREIVDLECLMNNNTWYVSDTKSYLSSAYIKKFGEDILDAMCSIVGIDQDLVCKNDLNAGGAQYLLKKVPSGFWLKIENDCTALFAFLTEKNKEFTIRGSRTIQAWCADMWAILWNALLLKKEIEIHPELNFCWPGQDTSFWERTKILHNAGVYAEKSNSLFCKGLYTSYAPFYENFTRLDVNKCSIKFVDEVVAYKNSLPKTDLRDVTFLFLVKIDSEDRSENLDIIARYIDKHFDTNIYIQEVDDIPRVNRKLLCVDHKYKFHETNELFIHRTKWLNKGIKKCSTPIIALYDIDVICCPESIFKAVEAIRRGSVTMAYPFDGRFISVNRSNIKNISMSLEYSFLSIPTDFSRRRLYHSYGGCVLIQKESYFHCGLENENLTEWGRDDVERAKRVDILGYQIFRAAKPLFHLDHYRGSSSKPSSLKSKLKNDEEYLKICSMTQKELENYVSQWAWSKADAE